MGGEGGGAGSGGRGRGLHMAVKICSVPMGISHLTLKINLTQQSGNLL